MEKRKFYIDITGTVLTPSPNGADCLGNGKCFDENGDEIECCCDECNYFLECFPSDLPFFSMLKQNLKLGIN